MIVFVTGRHRGRASLRWRLVAAVTAAAMGRGYVGRHRLEAAALGRRSSLSAPAVVPPAVPPAVTVPAAPPAQLAVVPVASSPDPLLDTVPHPVVKLFPLPVVDGEVVPAAGEDAVFAEVDRAREEQAVAELAVTVDVREHKAAYHGRHSA